MAWNPFDSQHFNWIQFYHNIWQFINKYLEHIHGLDMAHLTGHGIGLALTLAKRYPGGNMIYRSHGKLFEKCQTIEGCDKKLPSQSTQGIRDIPLKLLSENWLSPLL